MLSRTSARQQRMRQQTLNEERIAQDQLEPRTSSECRSKGSKLIISSPTTTSHPSLNILLSASQAPTQHIDDTTKLSNQYNRGFGASALLASLNANGQQHQTTSAHSTRLLLSTEDTQPVVSHLPDKNTQQSNLNLENYKSFLVTTNTTATQSFSVNNRNSIYTLTSNTVATTTTSNGKKTPNQTLPMHFAQRNVAQGHTQFHLQSKHNSFESVSPNTQLKSNSEFSGLEVESNESPTPSDMNSPVESCFANIMEDQGSDSFDLNNITPSINLSSSELESVTNVTSAQPQGSRNSSDYQSLLQEWVMLHENNLQNAVPIDTTNSPITRYSFPMNITDTAGSSSPGLSSVGTEEMINSDTKVIFSNSVPVPIVGSAPVPSNPLGSCSRMNSPISNMNIVSRPAGCGGSSATDSSLRLMRTRCTSLTVSTVGANSLSSDANIPGVRLHGSEYQSQANRLKSQRILQPHQSSHLRIFQPGNNHSGVGVSQTPLRGSQQFQSKPIPQSHLPSSSLSPQHNFIVQHQVNPSSSSGLGLTVRSNPNQELTNSHCLSASLPVNVNPLLCGLQDSDISDVTDDKSSQLYSFDSSSSFIVPQLKSEPICETDSMYGTMHSLGLELSHGNTGNTILEPVTHFDPLIASVVQTSHQHYHQQQQQERNHPHHYHHHHLQQQQQQQLHQQSHHHHLQQQYPLFNHTGMTSSKAVDSSTPPIGLDIDDFQFDDVPME
ncbi:unnamed protein product [Heterobilharzia americana]|nr:unnamed protein product [Heterobilharzia americana]